MNSTLNGIPSSPFATQHSKADKDLLTIYLAGGFRSGWQDQVIAAIEGVRFVDPRQHQLADEKHYTQWDLEGVRQSDWVFAFFETTNPGGFSLALEVGFAKALEKRIIYIDQKSADDPQVGRYLGMVRACADVVFPSLEEGIRFLQTLQS